MNIYDVEPCFSNIYEWLREPGAFNNFASVCRSFRDSINHLVVECPKDAVVAWWGFPCCSGKCSVIRKVGSIEFKQRGGIYNSNGHGFYEGKAAVHKGKYYAIKPLRGFNAMMIFAHLKHPVQTCPVCNEQRLLLFHTICGETLCCRNCFTTSIICPCRGRISSSFWPNANCNRCTAFRKCQHHAGDGTFVRLLNPEMY